MHYVQGIGSIRTELLMCWGTEETKKERKLERNKDTW